MQLTDCHLTHCHPGAGRDPVRRWRRVDQFLPALGSGLRRSDGWVCGWRHPLPVIPAQAGTQSREEIYRAFT